MAITQATEIKPFNFVPSPYNNRASRRADAVRHRKEVRIYHERLDALIGRMYAREVWANMATVAP